MTEAQRQIQQLFEQTYRLLGAELSEKRACALSRVHDILSPLLTKEQRLAAIANVYIEEE